MADWLCRGLQILVDRFDSVPGLFLKEITIRMKIGIVGAGIAGRLLAFKLKLENNNFDIYLFDNGHKSCSYMSAGMLSPFCELNSAEKIIADLGLESLNLWKSDIEFIEKYSHEKIFFQQNGTLVVAHRQDIEELKIFKRNIDGRIDGSLPPYEILNQNDIRFKEPDIEDKFSQGLFFEKDGRVDPRSFLFSIAKGLENIGIKISNSHDAKIDKNKINNEGFDLVFDCRGLGASQYLQENFNKKLRGVRGEIIILQVNEKNKIHLNSSIRLMHPRFPLYISPRENNKFIVGATMIESEDMSPISVRSSLELLTAVFSINSQFGESRILESNVQLRPTFEDNLPKILYDRSGYFSINGLYRHGFLMSPKIVNLAIRFALSGEIEKKYEEIFEKV